MAGFVASPPPPTAGSADAVEADGWFPAVSLAALRDSMRVGTAVTDARLRDAILGAMLTAMTDLASWQDRAQAAGAADLASVPDRNSLGASRMLGGQPRLVQLWRRAIASYAMADLAETQRPVAATFDGRQRAEEESVTAEEHRRNGLSAIRDILGRTRNRVSLL